MNSTKLNIIWNLLGSVLPLLTGIMLFPLIVSNYGLERFGLLTLAWSMIGYFGLFDLGLSRALTQLVSQQIAKKKKSDEIAELIRTSFRLMWLLGFFGGLVLWVSTPFIVIDLLKVSNKLNQETIHAFSALAFSIPFVVHTTAMRGVLEALNLFKIASVLRSLMGVGVFLGPYIATFFSNSLIDAIYSLVIVRLLVWVMHMFAINHSKVLAVNCRAFNKRWLNQLFSFGGWMTVTNLIGPLMVYLDRFVVVSILGAASVAYYVAPYEVVTKMLVIPAAISGVLFPLFAREWQAKPLESAIKLNQGISYTLLLLYPASLLLVYFANEWLSLWLGIDFSIKGKAVVVWLVAGTLVNSAAQIIFANVQGAGRSDWTAKLHLLELIPYLALLWWALQKWGIAGAAFAWFVRILIDMIGLLYCAVKINRINFHKTKQCLIVLLFATLILLVAIFPLTLPVRYIVTVCVFIVYLILGTKQLYKDNLIDWLKIYFSRNIKY